MKQLVGTPEKQEEMARDQILGDIKKSDEKVCDYGSFSKCLSVVESEGEKLQFFRGTLSILFPSPPSNLIPLPLKTGSIVVVEPFEDPGS